jgi:anti-sigma factor RsiW
MRCGTVQRKLDAYAAEELTPSLRRKMEAHLEACPACRRELARLRELATLLADAPAPPPVPDGFAERLMAKAPRRLAERQAAPRPAWHPLRWWAEAPAMMRAAAAAVLLIGLAAGTLMGWQTSQRAATSQTMAADPVATYGLDYLADAPEGSLAGVYLSLASSRDEGRE